MTSPKTYTLTITEEQAKTLQVACELLSRIQGGQVREVFNHLPLRKGLDWNVYHEIQDELTKRMPEILKDGIDGWSSHFGVGHPDLPKSHDIAWDLYQVVRHQLSWDYAVEQGWVEDLNSPRDWSNMLGCSYDEPMRFGVEPLAVMERVND
jgi:hypothetical protein